MRYNEKRERLQDLEIGVHPTSRVMRSDLSLGLMMIEYYNQDKRSYTYCVCTTKYTWVVTQSYNLVDHVFDQVDSILRSGVDEDDYYNSQESIKLVYER